MKHQTLKFGVLCALLGSMIICRGCPIKYITGISCAGCGMTRAWICALQLNVAEAFMYHPLFWTVPLFLILLIRRKKLADIIYKNCTALILIAFVAVYLMRLFDQSNAIVTIALSEGLVGKIIIFLGENVL